MSIKSELTFSGRAARLLNNVCFSVTTQEHEYVLENPDGITATRLNVDELISLALFLEELNVGRRGGDAL